jgi:hypothetical protein
MSCCNILFLKAVALQISRFYVIHKALRNKVSVNSTSSSSFAFKNGKKDGNCTVHVMQFVGKPLKAFKIIGQIDVKPFFLYTVPLS